MIALNDNTLFIGEIKQRLHEFNLPSCTVGFKNPAPNKHFIANGYINLWKESIDPNNGQKTLTYDKICPYVYNKRYNNLTTNLPIRNMIYDRETHRYLGKYLRFLRDYRNVNLMSMYNCFDEDIFEGDVSATRKIQGQDDETVIRFRNNTDGFYVYSVPVDFQKLTLRISSGSMSYICLCIDNVEMKKSNRLTDLNQELMNITLSKFNANEVLNYDPADYILRKLNSNKHVQKFSSSDMLEFIAANIKNLRLLIRVNKKSDIRITVLEGTYQINQQLLSSYFIIQPMKYDHAPLLMPRYIDISDESMLPQDSDRLDSDGYPVDFNNQTSTGSEFSDESNLVRFGLVKGRNLEYEDLYEILFIQYLIEPSDNKSFKNPLHFKESGFLIIPQLLQQNDTMNMQYLLADRIVEYLSGNVICPLSESYDIRRMQACYARYGYTYFNSNVDSSKYVYGIWSPLDLYNTRKIIADNYDRIDNIYDLLGYVDKDIEKILGDKLDDI